MRWFWSRNEEEEYVPPDDRLCQEEADAIYGLMMAASTAEEMGFRELRDRLLKEVDLLLRRGTPPASAASVHLLKHPAADSSPKSGGKS